MKKFAELDFVQNLGWTKLISVSLTVIAAYTSAIWGLSTWTAGNKADYVNMRYNELSALEEKLKTLESENIQLRQLLGKDTSQVSQNSNMNIKEIKENETNVDPITGLIISAQEFSPYGDNAINIKATFPNGDTKEHYIRTGDSYTYEFDNKKYQIIFTEVKDKSPAKYMIRQITEK